MNNKYMTYLLCTVIGIALLCIWINYKILGPELIVISYAKLFQMNFHLALISSFVSLVSMFLFTIIVLYLHNFFSDEIDSDYLG